MKYILFFLFFFISINSFGQTVGYSNQTIIVNGQATTIIQSIFFQEGFPAYCPLDSFSFQLNDTIHVELFYDRRGALGGFGCGTTDTLQIDSLPIGNYTIIFHTNLLTGFINQVDTLFDEDLDTAQIIITNSHSLDLSNSILLYPNPVQQYLDIEVKDIEVEAIYLFNIQGQLIKNIPKAERRLDLRNLDSSLYFLKIKTKKGWVNKKVMKQ